MRRWSVTRFIPFTLVLLSIACAESPTTTPQLQALLAGTAPKNVTKDAWSEVQAFYGTREQMLAWTVASGVNETTHQAFAVLDTASDHGLDPADYSAADLKERAASLEQIEDDEERARAVADLDMRITASLLRLARHVATGRLSPKTIDARWNQKRQPPDYVAALQKAADGELTTLLDALQPRHPEYQPLRSALTSLRAQAQRGWPSVPRTTLKVGQWHAAVAVLRQRLAASGYLPGTTPLDSTHFDADVEAAVKAFQEHHGLAATGVVDRMTIEKMNTPVDSRITQVAMNLERWRWLPDDLGTRHFLVNVPDFHLFARENGKVALDMRVVVGKRGNETPLFSDTMETVVFSPYWNVPETIALEETAPAVAQDPEFLARNNMEVVNAKGEVVSPESIPWGDEGALEQYRFRQRPGANNALGYVKFLFPNEHAVYLHDTPADTLFKRIGRAFSHGCVRVEQPAVLAKYVLRDQPEWTDDAIRSAMRAGDERHVKLAEKIPVHIVYMTAWVDPNGGLHFEDDVYGYDARQATRH
jgi:murein L,D-transpeptidase YcbB/YkuD